MPNNFGFQPGVQLGPNLGGFAPQKQAVATKQSNKASIIPTKPMQSYMVESTIMPGVADDKAEKIIAYAQSNAKSPEEEKLLLNDMHAEAIKMEQKKAFENERKEMKAQVLQDISKEKDPVKQKQMGLPIRLADFADIVRDGAKKSGVDLNEPSDEVVSTKFIESNPQFQQTFLDYVNGNIQSVDVGKAIGLIPAEETVVAEDEGLIDKLGNRVDDIKEAVNSVQNNGSIALQTLGGVAGMGNDIISAILDPVIKLGSKGIGKALDIYNNHPTIAKILTPKTSLIKKGFESLADTDEFKAGLAKIPEGIEAYNSWAKDHEEAAKNIGAAVDLAEFGLNFVGGELAVKAAPEVKATIMAEAKNIAERAVKNSIEFGSKNIEKPSYADKLLEKTHGFTPSEIRKYKAKFGETPGQTLNSRGLISGGEDTLNMSAEVMQAAQEQKKIGLATIKQPVPVNENVIKMAEEVAEFERAVATPEELKAGGKFKTYEGYVDKAKKGELTHTELEDIKSNFERNKALKYDATRTTSEQARLKNLDSSVRNFQQEEAAKAGFDNIKAINNEISKTKSIVDLLAKDVESIGGMGLSDYILLAGSTLDPTALGILAGKKILQTSWFKRNIIKILNAINGQDTLPKKAADIMKIKAINSEVELNKFLEMHALPAPKPIVIGEDGIKQTAIVPAPRANKPKEVLELGQKNVKVPINGKTPKLPLVGSKERPIIK